MTHTRFIAMASAMKTLSIGSRCSKKKAMPAASSRQQKRKSSLSMAW